MSQATTWGVPRNSAEGDLSEDAWAARADEVLDAILTSHKGATAPSYAVAGTRWVDDSATPWLVKTYDGTDWTVVMAIDPAANAIRWRWYKGADIASATALTPGGDGNYFDVTGTTTITSIATIGVGSVVRLHFDGALTLTHHATDLVLPGGANITTAAGDEAEFVEYASGDWRCVNYQPAATGPGQRPWTLTVVSATNAAWPVPAGTTEMIVEGFAAGASGAGGNTTAGHRGSGGGGGGYFLKHHNGVMDATLNIQIGAAGAAVAAQAGGASGNAGGNTTITGTNLGTLTANGGNGGTTGIATGGTGGSASGADINITGESGRSSNSATIAQDVFGGGGAPNGGPGGKNNVGSNGEVPGGGGACSNHIASNSGAGARGEARIWTR